jgi:hypothetical protein
MYRQKKIWAFGFKNKKDLARRRKSYSKKLDKKLNPKGLQALACLYFLSNFRSSGVKKNLIGGAFSDCQILFLSFADCE